MFSKGVILVEGIVEQILITTYVRLFNTSLDKLGISIININGIDFVPYVKLLGKHGFDIPIAIVTDGDPIRNKDSDSNLTNENNIPDGLKRGKSLAELLNPMQANLINLNLPHNEIRELLAQVGIFVGNHTLEIDLLEAEYWDEYLDTFRELGEGDQSIKNTENVFRTWANLTDDEKERKIVTKIKNICGKGRFAQRISSKLDTVRIPPYLRYALEFMGVI
jgi:putative ATP-dependent endonuclease of OLD family